jgi:cell division transport system ATP-binding protein
MKIFACPGTRGPFNSAASEARWSPSLEQGKGGHRQGGRMHQEGTMIAFQDVSKFYGNGVRALSGVTVKIPKGDFVFLVGPSGAGKSTLLKLIYRRESPTQGQILIDGRNIEQLAEEKIPYLRRNVGVVFQDFKLLQNRTVFENVAYALRVTEMPDAVIRSSVENVLDLVGLVHKKECYPRELSGGEEQRVNIARALVGEPAILLTDEPTANLDPEISRDILNLFLSINNRGTTVVVATHNDVLVNSLRKRVIALKDGAVKKDEEFGTYSYD